MSGTIEIARLFGLVVFFVVVLIVIQWVIQRVALTDKSRKKLR